MRLLHSIHQYDVFMFLWLLKSRRRTLYARICRYISLSGDGYLYLLLGVVLYWMHTVEAISFLNCILLALS